MPTASSATLGKKKLIMFEIPVVPITTFTPSVAKMQEIGFKVRSIGDYIVINDQRIVALNPAALKEDRMKPEVFLETVIAALNEKTQRVWMLVQDAPTRWRSTGLQYYWVMEQFKLEKLMGAVRSVEEWGFPFH